MAAGDWHSRGMAQIREAQQQDAEAIRTLGMRLREGVAPWRDRTAVAQAVAGWVEDALAHPGDSGRVMFVAEQGQQVVGFVTGGSRAHWSGDQDAYIGELAVAAELEGQGVGSGLLASVERWAAQRGYARIVLETGAANTRACAFYERHGYSTEEVVLSRALRT